MLNLISFALLSFYFYWATLIKSKDLQTLNSNIHKTMKAKANAPRCMLRPWQTRESLLPGGHDASQLPLSLSLGTEETVSTFLRKKDNFRFSC